jgi:CMP-N,N'-diacetyllegionaminic acid synthase
VSGALAIILARGGSKGVPGKNIAPIAGRPCIAWTIDAARQASSIARIIVSTDALPIAAVARDLGAEVVVRPAELASDTARVDDAARHALLQAEAGHPGETAYRPIVLLYANIPLRPPGLIDRAVALLQHSGADSVQSYSPVGKHHPWWMVRLDGGGRISPWEGDLLNHGIHRRQDLPPALLPDGAVIALTRPALMMEVPGIHPGPHAFLGLDRRGIVSPEGSVVDIDTPVDLLVADALLRDRADARPKATIAR